MPLTDKTPPIESPAPRGGLQLMGLILVCMALLAVYANVQKTRRAQIETVTITNAPAPAVSPSPAER
ncbi:MAG TPA: hypothetical protein VK474_11830 [Chthoniobacterales bacterium]|nr:hypothetical protein [Chthoniobacterales bacterium]